MNPHDAFSFFTRPARDGTEICHHEEDGSMRVMLCPQRRAEFDWHAPKFSVPPQQWRPETGITRYEFARRMTPKNQRPLFEALQAELQANPPRLPPVHLFDYMIASRKNSGILPSGLPGDSDMVNNEDLHDILQRYVLRAVSPDGQWRFTVQAVCFNEDMVADRLDVRHRDYRTIADWTLLVRFRSWCLNDDRTSFLYMPGQDIHEENWEHGYENATPNNLAIVSPRYTDGETICLGCGGTRCMEGQCNHGKQGGA